MWRDQGSAELAVTGHRSGAGKGPKVQGSLSPAPHDRSAWPQLNGQDSCGLPATPGPGREQLFQGVLQHLQRQGRGWGGLSSAQISGVVTSGVVVTPLSEGRIACPEQGFWI